MAPKGMKRPAAFAAEITTVKRALLMGDSGAALLAGMCSDSLGVPKSERHEFQASAVDMIAESLGLLSDGYKKSCEDLKVDVGSCEFDKDKRAAAVKTAESELVGLKEVVKTSAGALETAKQELRAASAALQKAEEEQAEGDSGLAALEATKSKVEAILADSLALVKETVVKANSKVFKDVLKLGKELGVDNTMLVVLAEGAKKPKEARSAFEESSFENISTAFTSHVQDLAGKIQEGEPAKAARAQAVGAAKAALEEAAKHKADADAALDAAKAAEKAGAAALKAAEKAVTSWLADTKKLMDKYDAAVVQCDEFTAVLGAFETLKELEPPPPPAEEPPAEVPAAGEAAPAEEASAAAA